MSAARRRNAWAAPLVAVIALALSSVANAWVPEPESAWGIVAQGNSNGLRTRPLSLDVSLVGADGAVAATGTARIEPSGNARLGITWADGSVEMHERSASDYKATRGGKAVDKPLRLLPPNALLQAATGLEVAEALRTIGGDPKRVDLGMEGAHDCWVLGGREMGSFDANTRASLWVDQESELPVRIDDGSGTQYRFGFAKKGEGIRFPAWIEVRGAKGPSYRIDIKAVNPAP